MGLHAFNYPGFHSLSWHFLFVTPLWPYHQTSSGLFLYKEFRQFHLHLSL